ncbi:hypothetical protein ADN00_14050 [Ornatilinea apprima]|uniref:Carboxypeptidase regulatory-like domain-containing protein n=1 Tax=Ornatilinea apprima TaxID=1134406 RepID=A0A0P6XGV6_9CHLR|nr:hypothetical protein [Ornatilinea apprima]KPL74121.1 hypothetical protein ADN00_14050 [Ornatilinea apprima]
MSLDNSPKLDQFKNGLPTQLPDVTARRRRQRLALTGLVVCLLALAGFQFLRSDPASHLAGVGKITGSLVDEQSGLPVTGEVFISGSDQIIQTDASGRFELFGVPSGPQSLVVVYRNTGRAYPIEVPRGSTLDVGSLSAPTLARSYLD